MAAKQPGAPVPLSGAYAMMEPDVGTLVREVLSKRSPELAARLARETEVSERDVRAVEIAFYHEFVQHLGEDWEPTSYGKAVDNAIGAFVSKFLIERES
jgi:hypothetical protein